MAGNDLNSFRKKWKHEIKTKQQSLVENCKKNQACNKNDSTSDDCQNDGNSNAIERIFNTSEYNSIAEMTSVCKELDNSEYFHTVSKKPKIEPKQPIALLTLEIPSYHQSESIHITNKTNNQSNASILHGQVDEDLLLLLIRDIDETTTIPFFDIRLPKEICIKILSHLDVADLCRCSCVSKAWASIANDELLWYNVYKRLGFKDQGSNVREQVDWKGLVSDGILRRRLVTQNWKERICQIQTFEYEKGGVLTACQLRDDLLIAGYANGFSRSTSGSKQTFSCGIVNVWHTDISVDPIYQYHVGIPANHIALASKETPLLLNISGTDVRIDQVNDEGQWQFMHSHTFEDKVSFVETLPDCSDANKTLFALSLKEDIFIYEARLNVFKELDKVAGTKVTSLACGEGLIAVGWAPFGFGIGTEFTAK
ncbi:F-box WD repeat-containing 8, partial [Paramuricea clavata]